MDANLLQTLIEYRWWILVPLSFGESTVVAFVAGMLAATGYFNIYVLSAFFFFRDIGLDLAYYALGHYAGKSRFVRGMLAKIYITEESIESLRVMWDKRPARTMLIGKLSYGIAMSFVIAAGTVGMSLRKFVAYGAMAAVLQYGVLLFLGYYFGASSGGTILTVINNIQYVLGGGAVVLVLYYAVAIYMRRKMLKEDSTVKNNE